MADLEPAAAQNNVGWPALWKKPSDGAVSDLKVIFRRSDSKGNLILSEQRGYRALSTQRSQRIGGYSVAFFSLLPVLTPAVEQNSRFVHRFSLCKINQDVYDIAGLFLKIDTSDQVRFIFFSC